MPEPKTRRPAYLGWSTAPPRSTPTSDRVVEEHQVDGRLERRGDASSSEFRNASFWVVMTPTSPSRSTRTGAEVARSRTAEAVEQRQRLRLRLRHRVHQMRAAARVGEHVGEEDPLLDLEALLVLLQQLALGVDRGAGRQEVGVALRGGVDELGDPQRPRHPSVISS